MLHSGLGYQGFHVASVLSYVRKKRGGEIRNISTITKRKIFHRIGGVARVSTLDNKENTIFISGIQCYLPLITKPNQTDY